MPTWTTRSATCGRVAGSAARRCSPRRARSLRGVRARRELGALGPPPAAPAAQAELRGRLHSKLRDRSRDQPPLRPVQRLLRADPGRVDGVLHAATGRPTTRRTRSPTRSATSSTWSATSSASARDAAARRRLRLGFAVACTPPSTTASRSSASRSPPSRRQFIDDADRRARAGGQRRDPAARLPRCDRAGRLRRRRLARDGRARRRAQLPDVRRRAARGRQARRPACWSSRCRAGRRHPGGGPFIESFIAPDMHMRPVGETVALLEAAGLEVRDVHALREHYVRTVAAWLRHFEANCGRSSRWSARRSRASGGSTSSAAAMAFRDGRMGVDQILARPARRSTSLPGVRQLVSPTAS